nr:hypothetical protein GCM10020185_78880 [Pseudomonas brassicacearum subsp. brassicacearum]
MKIALDPYMHRHLSLPDLCRKTAELGFEYLELSPREDFLPWWVRPRAHKERIAEFKKALRDHDLQLASLLPMYRWASPPRRRTPGGGELLEGSHPDRRGNGLHHHELGVWPWAVA